MQDRNQHIKNEKVAVRTMRYNAYQRRQEKPCQKAIANRRNPNVMRPVNLQFFRHQTR